MKGLIITMLATMCLFSCTIRAQEFVLFNEYVSFPGLVDHSLSLKEVSKDDVTKSLLLVKKEIERMNEQGKFYNQGINNCPYILEDWDDYFVQAISFLDKDNRHVLMLQFIHLDQITDYPDCYDRWINVSGGCSYFWRARVDLESKEVFSIVIG